MNDFSGKYVIVTGGSKGIGKAIATNFFERGATVLICARKKEDVDAISREIDPTGKRFFGITADVSKISDCRWLINFALKKFGTIDILINNAGIYGEIGEFTRADLKKWTKTIETNVFGTVYCTRFVLPIMKKQKKGKIVNLAGGGIGGKKALPNFSAYYTSKIAVSGFTEPLATEIGVLGIQVNCISPGSVNTGITDYLIAQGQKKAGLQMYNDALKQKKEGESSTEQITSLVAFLCSPEADHISGRLLSAKWDRTDILKKLKKNDLFKLRRIDNDFFYEK